MFVKGIDGERGEVISIQGEKATVKIQANESCEKCGLCERVSSTEMIVEAIMEQPVKEGERVVLSLRPGTIVKSAVILYIVPLFGLIIGYYIGQLLNSILNLGLKGELFPALMAILFLFVCFIPIRMFDKKKQKDSRYQVYLSKSLI